MGRSILKAVLVTSWVTLMVGIAVSAGRWEVKTLPKTNQANGQDPDQIQFIDDKTGWIEGWFPGILKTTDGGSHWTRLDSNLRNEWISWFWFADRNRGWAVAVSYDDPRRPRQDIVFTKDGGRSWEIQRSIYEDAYYHVRVWFLDDLHGWVVGRREVEGLVLATSDGGEHWEVRYQDQADLFGSEIRAVRFTSPQSGWVLSSDAIGHTTDGGRTWSIQYKGDGLLDQLEVVSPNEAWALGSRDLLHTQNGGATWETTPGPGGEDTYLAAMKFANRSHGWMSGVVRGGKGILFSTVDAGKTWQQEDTRVDGVLRGIATTSSHVFVLADPLQILITRR